MENNVITEYVGQSSQVDVKHRWWREPDADIHKSVWQIVNSIQNNQTFLRAAYARFASLYSNMEFLGLSSRIFSRTALNSFFNNRLSLNVIKSCVDTVTCKIGKNRPRPLFLTSNGDFTLQRKAKYMTKYLDGLFDATQIYSKGIKAFRDGAIFGIGILKFFKCDGTVKVDRVFPEEIVVDEADGMYGEPCQIHHIKYIPRDTLLEMFPKNEFEIRSAQQGVRNDIAIKSSADQLAVIESWHLPSGPDAKDGKHTITIDNCTLFAEKYEKDYFPFVFIRWNPRVYGFFGMGLAEELTGIQLEMTKIIQNIQKAVHLVGHPRVFIDVASGVDIHKINNDDGGFVKGNFSNGKQPIFHTAASMATDVYMYLENLYKKAYEITGISQLSANSQKPAGLNSGVALRTYQDVESERFIAIGQEYEKFYMDAAKIMIDMTRDLEESGELEAVKVKNGKFIEQIKWKEVSLKNDQYMMQVFPTSILPHSPAGRLQTVQELIQSGFMSKDDALSLLDFPDLEGFMSLANAAKDDVNKIIENMIENGEYQTPEPYMNIGMAIQMVQSAYLRGKVNSVPEEKLELLRRFMEECQVMIQPPAPIEPPVQTAVPQLPPKSELIPSLPQ